MFPQEIRLCFPPPALPLFPFSCSYLLSLDTLFSPLSNNLDTIKGTDVKCAVP